MLLKQLGHFRTARSAVLFLLEYYHSRMMSEELEKQLKHMDISSINKNMLLLNAACLHLYFTTTEAGAAATPVTPV